MEAEVNTHSGHIWMVNPRLEDEWTHTIYNNNRIIVLFCYSKNKCVSSMPCRQVVSAKESQLISPTPKFFNEDMPIAFITIHRNISFATVRSYEDKRGRSFAGHVTSPRKIKILQLP